MTEERLPQLAGHRSASMLEGDRGDKAGEKTRGVSEQTTRVDRHFAGSVDRVRSRMTERLQRYESRGARQC